MLNKNPKNNEDYWMLKSDPLLKKKLNYVRDERIKLGKNTSEDISSDRLSYKRLSLAIARSDVVLNELIRADISLEEKNERK